MSYFENILFLLKKEQDPKSFLIDFHQKLHSLGITIDRDHSYVVFNDLKNEEEQEPAEIPENASDEEILKELYSWKGLGLLGYFRDGMDFYFSINYLSWDDAQIQGFDVGVQASFISYVNERKRFDQFKQLIVDLAEVTEYEFFAGDLYGLDPLPDYKLIRNPDDYYKYVSGDLQELKAYLKSME